jgi:hypothetical protein
MAEIVKAPNPYERNNKFTIFLGGAIDMGKAEDWQSIVEQALQEYNILILNPRRNDWDSSWTQHEDDPQFKQQVEWELQAQDDADLRLYVFASNEEHAKLAKAPITFMEYGLYAKEFCIICCPDGFYRKGNVMITAKKYHTTVLNSLTELITQLREILNLEGLL